jgi:16S rRNA G527 N7-methylase RsmG
MPKFAKEKIEKKINRLKEDANYWKETLDKQKKELVKYQKLKDKDNYKITLMAIKEIERHYQKTISRLEFFIRQLNVINNKN